MDVDKSITEQEMLANHRANYRNFSIYCDKGRMNSFWHQCDEIFSALKGENGKVLEIGVGSGILKCLLEHFKVDCKTLDIDSENKPDYVGSVAEMPFEDSCFDIACCFQVLEHIPYDFFEKSLSELFRVASKVVLVSIPDTTPCRRIILPKIGQQILPLLFPKKKKVAEFTPISGHYWELGNKDYELSKILQSINSVLKATDNKFLLEKHYRVFENTYHHFFIFRKGGF